MPRLLRVHFASIGHPDARLAPLTLDLRARDGSGTGTDSMVWLRNGGGKSTILNLFYSLFRPDRRDFLGTSAEGKARHLEDYVKADDLAFVVTEWDVEPGPDLFRAAGRTRIVGQVLSWKDRQKSSDPSKLRRRYFTLYTGAGLGFSDLPIEGLSPAPVRSFDAFRDWLDALRQERTELQTTWEDTPRKWTEHLEKVGLDPELFRYQLRMNAREGSADEAFRFRTTDEFVRFYLEMSFDTAEADQVSANVEGFRVKLAQRPGFLAEQAFLVEARHQLVPLREAVARESAARVQRDLERSAASAVAIALCVRAEHHRGLSSAAGKEAERARRAAQEASNAAARRGRWANGLDRRALELDVAEAEVRLGDAAKALAAAAERVRVGEAAVARDERHRLQAERDAKAEALRLAQAEQEPLRRQVARAGTTLRARLTAAASAARAEAERHCAAQTAAAADRDAVQKLRDERIDEAARLAAEIAAIDRFLAERDRDREQLRHEAVIEDREEVGEAAARWKVRAEQAREQVDRQVVLREDARARVRLAEQEAAERATTGAALSVEIRTEAHRLETARAERERLRRVPILVELEGEDADLEAVGLTDRLGAEAEGARRRVLVAAVDGAEDDRALQALESTGRLPPPADVERAVATLRSAHVSAFSGPEYLAQNVEAPAEQARLVRGDPAAWYGVVVLDPAALAKAGALLETLGPRTAVTVALPALDPVEGEKRVVLPGHPAHWDPRAGTVLRDELADRRRKRERERDDHQAREKAARDAASAVERWRATWGDGRLAVAESDQEQRVARWDRNEAERLAALASAEQARAAERAAEEARAEAEGAAALAARRVERIAAHVERFEAHVDDKRAARARAEGRRAEIGSERQALEEARAQHDAAWLAARDAAADAARDGEALLAEHDRVDLSDDDSPSAEDLLRARASWAALRDRWQQVVSDTRLQWELEEFEQKLHGASALERTRSAGREADVARISLGGGPSALREAEPRRDRANEIKIAAEVEKRQADEAVRRAGIKRRDADDLPGDAPPPATAALARERSATCREERDLANERARAESEEAARHEGRARDAAAEASACAQHHKRLHDVLGDEERSVPPAELPDAARAVEDLVDERVAAARHAEAESHQAQKAAEVHGEALREVALSAAHEAHRSRVRERLKAPAAELAASADELHRDVEDRLAVVRTTLEEIEQDRRLVLQELDKVGMDAVQLLRAAERASRLPPGLGVWEGEPFVRIRVDVAGNQVERQPRLEALLDRLVAKGTIPGGRELADLAVLELAGQRLEVTVLKPDAHLRRDRLPVTEMQTFSRGQQLTAAILLYCTMARVRAQQRGHGQRPDAGVLLLDNPVGTCSSVPLLELQHLVARQMRIQLVYTTGVNDPDAIATFPNTIRLRNAHRARASGDLHVTVDDSGLEAVRVVEVGGPSGPVAAR